MAVRCNPVLSFRDSACEAMDFYHSVFGGELALDTFEEFNASDDPSEKNKIMHAQLEGDNGVVLMGADTPNSMEYTPAAGISIVLSGDDEKVLRGYWDKLSSSGTGAPAASRRPARAPGLTVIRFGRVSGQTGETGTKTPSPSDAPRRTRRTYLAQPWSPTKQRAFQHDDAVLDLRSTAI